MRIRPYSGVILTFNEASTIEGAIDSLLKVCTEVVVLDSDSTDNTCAIATSCGAKVINRSFDNYANQRNFALNCIDFNNELILMFDADERLSPCLVDELLNFAPSIEFSMGRIRRIDFYKGHPLKRSVGYPTWGARVFRAGSVDVIRDVNEEFIPNGKIHYFQEHFYHFPFMKGLRWWFERHAKYADMEATVLLERNMKINLLSLISVDSGLRRSAWKNMVYKLPFRPLIIFIYFYIINMGFLDGKAGFLYCYQRFVYECMINSFRSNKTLEKTII